MLLNVTNLSQLQQKRIDITTNKMNCIVVLNVTRTINMHRTYTDKMLISQTTVQLFWLWKQVFNFKSRLTAHKKVHKKSVDQTCKKCAKVFQRKDYFDPHLKYCIGYNNDEFDSSSEQPSIVDVYLVIDPPGEPTFEPSTDSPEDQNKINLEDTVNQFSESSPISLSNPRNEYFKKYWSDTRKAQAMNLESTIQNLSSPVKNKTLRNINHSVNDILTNTSKV